MPISEGILIKIVALEGRGLVVVKDKSQVSTALICLILLLVVQVRKLDDTVITLGVVTYRMIVEKYIM